MQDEKDIKARMFRRALIAFLNERKKEFNALKAAAPNLGDCRIHAGAWPLELAPSKYLGVGKAGFVLCSTEGQGSLEEKSLFQVAELLAEMEKPPTPQELVGALYALCVARAPLPSREFRVLPLQQYAPERHLRERVVASM
jgi:hypothetical protein